MPLHPAAIASAVVLCACAAAPPRPAAGQIEHVVLIWLQDPADRAARDRMIAAARAFPAQIPGIVSLRLGGPLPSDRDVVDDSFDLALVVGFADRDALAAYEVHPVHVRAVAEVLRPHIRRLQVYDVAVE